MKIVYVCLILTSVAVAAIFIFKIPINNVLTYGVFLLCPLMHIFMMKNMGHSHGGKDCEEEKKKEN